MSSIIPCTRDRQIPERVVAEDGAVPFFPAAHDSSMLAPGMSASIFLRFENRGSNVLASSDSVADARRIVTCGQVSEKLNSTIIGSVTIDIKQRKSIPRFVIYPAPDDLTLSLTNINNLSCQV